MYNISDIKAYTQGKPLLFAYATVQRFWQCFLGISSSLMLILNEWNQSLFIGFCVKKNENQGQRALNFNHDPEAVQLSTLSKPVHLWERSPPCFWDRSVSCSWDCLEDGETQSVHTAAEPAVERGTNIAMCHSTLLLTCHLMSPLSSQFSTICRSAIVGQMLLLNLFNELLKYVFQEACLKVVLW